MSRPLFFHEHTTKFQGGGDFSKLHVARGSMLGPWMDRFKCA